MLVLGIGYKDDNELVVFFRLRFVNMYLSCKVDYDFRLWDWLYKMVYIQMSREMWNKVIKIEENVIFDIG